MSPRRRFAAVAFIALALTTVYSLRIRLHISHYSPLRSTWFEPSSPDPLPTTGKEIPTLHHLRRLCDQTTWTDGLWLQCHSSGGFRASERKSFYGGLNNVRSRLQTCLRLAIDSGSGLIIANITTRDQTKLKALGNGDLVDASRFWDTEYLAAAISSECPQLKLRFHGDASGIETILEAPYRHWSALAYYKGVFQNITTSLLATANITHILPDAPVAISFSDSFIAWDYSKSDELSTVRKDLFKTINYNQTLLQISSQILHSPQLQRGFIGIHLRAESDWPRHFGKAFHQMRLYKKAMEEIERKEPSHLRTVYVSCGNRTAIQTFRDKLTPLGYEVHDKWTLLADNPGMLEQMDNLGFDEKGAVEYQMLLNADIFMGPITSSMTTLIAYARTVDDEEDFFHKYIYPHSRADPFGSRMRYYKKMSMHGNSHTKLMVVTSTDRMNFFP